MMHYIYTHLSYISYTAFLILFGYFILLTSYYLLLGLIGILEGKRMARENEVENYPLVYLSTFNIPVSIIIPARNEQEWIRDCLLSVLNINYPTFEVIIVNDGSTDKTLEILDEMLNLTPIDAPYIKHYKDGLVRNILRSGTHSNVTVIDKNPGFKKAGALNAGLNIAKNDFVCIMDSDTILEPDALLKVMTKVEKDPDRTLGIGSYFGLVNGLRIEKGRVTENSFSYNPIVAYQNIEYIRSFIGNRIAWSKFNATPNVAGGFGIWRRDVLYHLGGFSKDFTCEDIEMTFRAQDYIVKNIESGFKILSLPYSVGWTEGPSNIPSLISQRERWQRVTNETLWRYKYMLFNPKFGSFAFLTVPYFIIYEVLGVFFELTSIVMIAFGCIFGILDVKTFLIFMLLMVLSQTTICLVSILAFIRIQSTFGIRYVLYLLGLTFTEFLFYRWLISVSKIIGTVKWLRGVKAYDQYARPPKK